MVAVLHLLIALGVAAHQVKAISNTALPVAHLKRDFTAQTHVLGPVSGASRPCEGLTTCEAGIYCCPADQSCCLNGCMPAGDSCCIGGYCQAGWGCCGTGCFPSNVGATCCGGKGFWCPANFQCIRYDIVEYKCCTDDTCDVSWDGTSTVSVSTTTSTTTTTTNSTTTTPTTDWTTTTPTTSPISLTITTVVSSQKTTTTTPPKPKPTKCNPTGPQPTFHLVMGTSSYLSLSPPSASNGQSSVVQVIANNIAQGTLFTFNSACNLVAVSNGRVADIPGIPYEGGSVAVHFDSLTRVSSNHLLKLVCDLQAGGQLACKAGVNGPAAKWMACGTPSALKFWFSLTACGKVANIKAILK